MPQQRLADRELLQMYRAVQAGQAPPEAMNMLDQEESARLSAIVERGFPGVDKGKPFTAEEFLPTGFKPGAPGKRPVTKDVVTNEKWTAPFQGAWDEAPGAVTDMVVHLSGQLPQAFDTLGRGISRFGKPDAPSLTDLLDALATAGTGGVAWPMAKGLVQGAAQQGMESAKAIGRAVSGTPVGFDLLRARSLLTYGQPMPLGPAPGAIGVDEAVRSASEAGGHGLAAMVPFFGPDAASIAEDWRTRPKYAAGRLMALLMTLGAPSVIRGMRGKPKPMLPEEPIRAATRAMMERDVPLSYTTVGGPFSRSVEELAINSPLGSGFAQKARRKTDVAMAKTGRDLVEEALPGQRHTPLEVGQEILGGEGHVRGQRDTGTQGLPAAARGELGKANTAYDTVRAKTQGVSIDHAAVKAELAPLVAELEQQARVLQNLPAQTRLGKANQAAIDALPELRTIMEQPDRLSLADADLVRGSLNRLANTVDRLDRTRGQGMASKAAKLLDDQIQAVFDPYNEKGALIRHDYSSQMDEAQRALQTGRAATTEKYAITSLLDELPDDAVRLVKRLTAGEDINVGILADIEKRLPGTGRKIGQAAFARQVEGFIKTGKPMPLRNWWVRLGETQQRILFPDKALRTAIDQYTLVAEKNAAGRPIRRVGSAQATLGWMAGAAGAAAGGAAVGSVPGAAIGFVTMVLGPQAVLRLFNNPRFVRTVTKLEATPRTAPGRYAARMREVVAVAKAAGVQPVAGWEGLAGAPVMAHDPTQTGTRQSAGGPSATPRR